MKSWSAHTISSLKNPTLPYGKGNRSVRVVLVIEEAPWYIFLVRWLSTQMDKLVPDIPLPPIPIRNRWYSVDEQGNKTGSPDPIWIRLSDEYPDLNEYLYLRVWTVWHFWARNRIKQIKTFQIHNKEEARGLMSDQLLDCVFKTVE